jgi:hypothetical protein
MNGGWTGRTFGASFSNPKQDQATGEFQARGETDFRETKMNAPLKLNALQRRAIINVLKARKGKEFQDPERQAVFLGGIEHALNTRSTFAYASSLAPIKAEDFEKLRTDINATSDAVVRWLSDFEVDVNDYVAQAQKLADAAQEIGQNLKLKRGEKRNGPPGNDMKIFVSGIAGSWHQAFGRSANANVEGPFCAVLNVIISQTLPGRKVGNDALRSILNPVGK